MADKLGIKPVKFVEEPYKHYRDSPLKGGERYTAWWENRDNKPSTNLYYDESKLPHVGRGHLLRDKDGLPTGMESWYAAGLDDKRYDEVMNRGGSLTPEEVDALYKADYDISRQYTERMFGNIPMTDAAKLAVADSHLNAGQQLTKPSTNFHAALTGGNRTLAADEMARRSDKNKLNPIRRRENAAMIHQPSTGMLGKAMYDAQNDPSGYVPRDTRGLAPLGGRIGFPSGIERPQRTPQGLSGTVQPTNQQAGSLPQKNISNRYIPPLPTPTVPQPAPSRPGGRIMRQTAFTDPRIYGDGIGSQLVGGPGNDNLYTPGSLLNRHPGAGGVAISEPWRDNYDRRMFANKAARVQSPYGDTMRDPAPPMGEVWTQQMVDQAKQEAISNATRNDPRLPNTLSQLDSLVGTPLDGSTPSDGAGQVRGSLGGIPNLTTGFDPNQPAQPAPVDTTGATNTGLAIERDRMMQNLMKGDRNKGSQFTKKGAEQMPFREKVETSLAEKGAKAAAAAGWDEGDWYDVMMAGARMMQSTGKSLSATIGEGVETFGGYQQARKQREVAAASAAFDRVMLLAELAKDHTPESVQAFVDSGYTDYSALRNVNQLEHYDKMTESFTLESIIENYRTGAPLRPKGGGGPRTKTLADGTILMHTGGEWKVASGASSKKQLIEMVLDGYEETHGLTPEQRSVAADKMAQMEITSEFGYLSKDQISMIIEDESSGSTGEVIDVNPLGLGN